MCVGELATEKDEERVASLFRAIGKVWTADEKYFDAVTGLRYIFCMMLHFDLLDGNNLLFTDANCSFLHSIDCNSSTWVY